MIFYFNIVRVYRGNFGSEEANSSVWSLSLQLFAFAWLLFFFHTFLEHMQFVLHNFDTGLHITAKRVRIMWDG